MFSGVALLAAAVVIGYNALVEIRTPHHAPAWFTLPVLVAVVFVKEALSRKVLTAGASLDSSALKGDAWHHRSDAITSAAAAIGISIALVGGRGYESADDWAALAACVIIVFNGFLILRGSLHSVLDGRVSSDLETSVCSVAATTPGIVNTEKCRIRKSGIDLYVEIHIRVDPSISVLDGHHLGHEVKERLLAANPRIRDVIVHIEPATMAQPIDEASIFFRGALIWGKRAAGARSSMKRLLARPRATVSSIRACPWAWEMNSNSYLSDQAGPSPRGQDRPGQLASKKQELFIT